MADTKIISVMKDLGPFIDKEVTLTNQEERFTGYLIALCLVGKIKGSIGKAYLKYKKKNGLPGNKGINIFPNQTRIESG